MTGIAVSSHTFLRKWWPAIGLSAALVFLASCGGTGEKAGAGKSAVLKKSSAPVFTPLDPAFRQRLADSCRSWYDTFLMARNFNGGMLVAKNGEVVFEAYNGTAHLPGTDTVNSTTPLHVASVSKTFTAMAVLQLVQQGRVRLDDSLERHFPEFNYPGVTVRTLLNHRSGLPNYVYFMEKLGWPADKTVRNRDVFDYLVARKTELTGIEKPDTRFSYCNTNYALLALLIEKISGKNYRQYIHENMFAPLGMRNSFVYDTSMAHTAVPSYDWRGTEMAVTCLDAVYGDKNIYTTPRDLLRWDAALYDTSFLSPALLKAAFTPYSNEKPGIRNYGLGWRLFLLPSGKKIVYHNGWWHGNNATFIRLPQDSAVIIVTGNRFNRNIYHARALARFLGDYGFEDEEDEHVAVGVPDAGGRKQSSRR
jgi:CubicO group peptidase (beta-lactamase class C family)